MTTINVTTTQAEVIVTEESGVVTTVTTPSAPVILTAVTAGPQGPAGPALSSIGQIPDIDIANVTDQSVLYYDQPTSMFRAGPQWTTSNLTDGGNF